MGVMPRPLVEVICEKFGRRDLNGREVAAGCAVLRGDRGPGRRQFSCLSGREISQVASSARIFQTEDLGQLIVRK